MVDGKGDEHKVMKSEAIVSDDDPVVSSRRSVSSMPPTHTGTSVVIFHNDLKKRDNLPISTQVATEVQYCTIYERSRHRCAYA